jgi:hypothetical protein
VEALHRLSREAAKDAVYLLQDIFGFGVTVVTLDDGSEYTRENLRGDFMVFIKAGLIFARGHQESKRKSDMLRAMWKNKRAKVEQGVPLTAVCPAWMKLDKRRKEFILEPAKVEAVQRVFNLAGLGWGTYRIAKELNAEGVPTLRGGKYWHAAYLAQLLKDRAVLGEFTPHRSEIINGKRKRIPLDPVPNYYPAIVDPALFQRVQDQRSAATVAVRGKHASKPFTSTFSGVLKCHRCGGTVTRESKGNGRGQPYLVCVSAKNGGGCKLRRTPYRQVEAAFLENLPYLLSQAPTDTGASGAGAELERLAEEIERRETERGNLVEHLKAGGPMSLVDALRGVEADLERLQAQSRELWQQFATTDGELIARKLADLEAAAQADPLDREALNGLMRQVFDRIVLDRPSGDLVCHWRHGGEPGRVLVMWPDGEGEEAA